MKPEWVPLSTAVLRPYKLTERQKEIIRLMHRSPTLWPDRVSWKNVSSYARRHRGVREQALRRTLISLSKKGLVDYGSKDPLGDYAPFNTVLTKAGEEVADELLFLERKND